MRGSGLLFACLLAACVLPELATEVPPIDPNACRTCAAESCAQEYDACVASSSCDQLLACALRCPPGDDPCRIDCANQHPDDVGLAVDLLNCATAACPDTCGGEAGEGGGGIGVGGGGVGGDGVAGDGIAGGGIAGGGVGGG